MTYQKQSYYYEYMNDLFIKKIYIDWSKVTFDNYLYHIEALKNLNELTFEKPITFFVGENGTGKSTLLEAIAIAYGLNPEGGSRNYSFSTYDTHSSLYKGIRLSKSVHKPKWSYFLRAESFYNVATKEMDYADIGHPSEKYHEQSHGESFLSLVQKQLNSYGLYLLDEPEAALSPQRQLTLLMEIYNSAKQGAQFIIATHSPILLGIPDAQILSFDDGIIHECTYEETDSYKIVEMYINNKDQLLNQLFKDE